MGNKLILFLIIFGIFILHSESFSQKRLDYQKYGGLPVVECSVRKPPFKFKITEIARPKTQPELIGIRVVLKPKYFNRVDMIAITKFLTDKYCQQNKIGITFFDDKAVALDSRSVVDHLTGAQAIPQLRGFFSFNRESKIAELGFSTQRGNPTDEIIVDLSNL